MSKAIEKIHNELQQLFGSNTEERFCMMIPGMNLDPTQFTWNTEGVKPASVKAAESQLANLMFHPVDIANSPNGQHLATQYLMALSFLVPRFNEELMKTKAELRDFLNSIPNYRLKGHQYSGSTIELYAELFGRWVEKKQEWSEIQQDKKEKLREKYTDASTGKVNEKAVNEEFLEWYETNAEGQTAKLNAEMGNLLGFFSPTDMNAILGVLEAGPGGAIQEARQNLLNIRKALPDGGYSYPVQFTPRDWFIDLTSDINPVDLLQDRETIQTQLDNRRNALNASLTQLNALIKRKASDRELHEAADKMADAERAYSKAQLDLVNTYTENSVLAFQIYMKNSGGGNPELAEVNKVKKGLDGDQSPISQEDLEKIEAGQKDALQKQQELTDSAEYLATTGIKLLNLEGGDFGDLTPLIYRVKAMIDDVNTIEKNLVLAAAKETEKDATAEESKLPGKKDGKFDENEMQTKSQSSDGSDRFVDLTMYFTSHVMSQESKLKTSFEQTSWHVSLFFGSASGHKEKSSLYSEETAIDKETAIEIGMKVAKVNIERNWFEPGIFNLTSTMNRLSDLQVTLGLNQLGQDNERAIADNSLISCYPTSFLVAKDITIRFKASEASLNAIHTLLDTKSSIGGGLFCFSASHSEASHDDKKSVTHTTTGNVITIRIQVPQMIGWFLQFAPEDKSIPISQQKQDSQTISSNSVSILEYVQALRVNTIHTSEPTLTVHPGASQILLQTSDPNYDSDGEAERNHKKAIEEEIPKARAKGAFIGTGNPMKDLEQWLGNENNFNKDHFKQLKGNLLIFMWKDAYYDPIYGTYHNIGANLHVQSIKSNSVPGSAWIEGYTGVQTNSGSLLGNFMINNQ